MEVRKTNTSFCKFLEKHISSILSSTSELEREITIHRDLLVGELNITMAPFAAEISGNNALGSLISKYPQIRCRVTSSDWYDVEKMVLERKADVGFAELYEAEKNKSLSTELIGQYQVVFFCRHGHPLFQKTVG
jgi:DNA-binding transcriptional LysR family regulator